METLVALSTGLNVSIDYLVFGKQTDDTFIPQKEPSYTYKMLKSLTNLVEGGFICVVDDPNIEGLAINLIKNPYVLSFFKEITNFSQCKNRMDDVTYEKGVDRIIKEYEYKVYEENLILNPPFGYPDYSHIQKNNNLYYEIMDYLKKKYKN